MIGDLRVRLVEYSAGYMADHWYDLGHVLNILERELDTELRHGRTFKLRPRMSYQVSDHGDAGHRSSTRTGAKLFIVNWKRRVASAPPLSFVSFAEQFSWCP